MLTNDQQAVDDGNVTIGDTKHGGRNLVIGGAVAIAALVLGGYYVMQGKSDAPKLAALASFRAAYAEKCSAAEFRGATPSYVATEYLDHEDLRNAVAQQQAALASGDCKDIDRALRSAGFPINSAKPQ